MPYQVGKTSPKRHKPTYIYSIISIALILYILGLLGVIIFQAKKLSDYFKENIEISIILKDKTKEADIIRLQKNISVETYTKSAEYISKEQAAKRLKTSFNEDFLELLGYNPLYASINIFLKADYANPDSLKWIESGILQNNAVQEIYYQRSIVSLIHKNVRVVGIIILSISIILFLIALTLINNTIRLSMYSNRFLIKSMQLVGATWRFIIHPFLLRAISNGFISSIIAIIGLAGSIYYVQQQLPELSLLVDINSFVLLFFAIIFTGIIISWWSTRIAVRKYLRMRLDELY